MKLQEIRRYEFLRIFARVSLSEDMAREHAIDCEIQPTDWQYIDVPGKGIPDARCSLSQDGNTEWQRLRNGFTLHYGRRFVDIENSYHFEKWYRLASRLMDPLTLVVYAMRRIYGSAPVIEIGHMLNIDPCEVVRRLRRSRTALDQGYGLNSDDTIESVIARYHELNGRHRKKRDTSASRHPVNTGVSRLPLSSDISVVSGIYGADTAMV